jgi:tellurite resistance protein TehA-like permease/quercetin dioxygenase-like cupin family protein
MSTEGEARARAASRAAAAVRDLHPGYFAFVMATGIISTGMSLLGPPWLSRVLLTAAAAGLAVLTAALAARVTFFRPSLAADFKAPERVFGFFTIVAGLDVLGVRLAAAGHPLATAILAGLAAVVWLLLTYGVPASLLLTRAHDSVLGGVNGGWLLWVVATQSLSIAASALVPVWPSQSVLVATAAAGLWSIGLVLYLLLVSLILLRWLSVPMTPESLGPPYWILMGATAITVFAGARILDLPDTLAIIQATRAIVEGFSFVLWAFGTWWIPLLIVLGLWRHVAHHWPLSYEPSLWSVVFPLGMYSVATLNYGEAAHLSFTRPLARVMLWVAVTAWALVAAAFIVRLARQPATQQPGTTTERTRSMQKLSLDALSRELLERAAGAAAGRTAQTVIGGHEKVLRQTVIAMVKDAALTEHASPGEASVHVLRGRVLLTSGDQTWEGRDGDLLIVPDAPHSLQALQDSTVLLTVAKLL